MSRTQRLGLNGGTIKLGTKNAYLSLGSHAITNAAAHKVGTAPPSVAGLSIGSPPVGDTFERGDTGLPTMAGAPGWVPDRLAMEVGYGIALPGGNHLKPFGRWSREGAAGHRVNVGTRWALLGSETTGQEPAAPGLHLVMDLFGEHMANGFQPPERRVGLLGRIVFE